MVTEGIAAALLPLHVATGVLALVCGYFALSVSKGAPLHRRSGLLFVAMMIPMSLTGMLISALAGVAPAINIPAALVTFYMVITALTTVRPQSGARWLDVAGMRMAFALAVICGVLAVAVISGGGARAGMAYPLVIFGAIAAAAGRGDQRLIRAGGIHGSARLRRHVWRMCFALLVAAGSFFSSAARVPAPLPLRLLPIFAVLVTMAYWMWRLRARRPGRHASETEAPAHMLAT